MMFFGFWVMGNKQIFWNVVEGREFKTDPIISGHNGFSLRLDQTLPLFIIGCLLVLFIVFTELFVTILRKMDLIETPKEDEVDE